MAGRRERQKEARERRIVRAARQLFAARGYAQTGMNDIARRARLAVGTLYNYFPSKPELALAIVRGETVDAMAAGESILEKPPRDPVAAVTALIGVYLEAFAHEDRALFREALAASMIDPTGIGQRFYAQDLLLIAQLGALIETLRRRGAIAAGVDTGRGAITLYTVFTGWFMAFIASDSLGVGQLRDEVHHGIRIALHGLLEPPTGRVMRGTGEPS